MISLPCPHSLILELLSVNYEPDLLSKVFLVDQERIQSFFSRYLRNEDGYLQVLRSNYVYTLTSLGKEMKEILTNSLKESSWSMAVAHAIALKKDIPITPETDWVKSDELLSTIELLKKYHQELVVFSCFGLDKEAYLDHYDPKTGLYIIDIAPEKYNPAVHLLEEEWWMHPDDDEAEEMMRRGLIKKDGKFFFPQEIVSNIFQHKGYIDHLVCYNFTAAVQHLLENSRKGEVLVDPDPERIAGYGYEYRSPVGKEDRLSSLLKQDGIYVCQIKFTEEDHAFVLVINRSRMTVLNRYSGEFYVVEVELEEGLGKLRKMEKNDEGNRKLVKEICGFEPWFPGEYMILHLIQCDYWERGVNFAEMADFFLHVKDFAFRGREEEKEILKVVENLRENGFS